MKLILKQWVGVISLATMLTMTMSAKGNDSGQVDFGSFTPSKSGSEFVEVNINCNLMTMAARLTEKSEPELTSLLKGLKRIRVNVIGLKDDNRSEVLTRIKQIQSDLEAKQWERLVSVQEEKEDVKVYIKTQGSDVVEGLVVLVTSEDSEAVLINIVGSIRPEQLATVGERFNIDPLKKAGEAISKKP